MLALEAPGNISRDISLYRRSLFAATLSGSALAFPDAVPLAFARSAPCSQKRACASLETAWKGISGSFSSEGIVSSGKGLYLGLGGPLAPLAEASRSALANLGFETAAKAPLETGLGFFLCARQPLADAVSSIAPPSLNFRDCSLVLFGLRFAADPFSACTWLELARSRRRTGPSEEPSKRRRPNDP